jgi:phosphate transport system substrate-binding protein
MNNVASKLMKIAVGLCLMLLPAGAIASDLSGQLLINGSDTLELLIVDLAKSFMKSNKGVKIVVKGGGSGKGINDVRSGVASIGMVSRVLTPQETVDLRAHLLAYDGICFVTSKKNSVQSLTPAQLEGIYQGKFNNWNQVGGSNLPITPIIRDRSSSSNKIVADFLGIKDTDLRGKMVNEPELAIQHVSTDPKAIAYVSSGEAYHDKLAGMPITILSISGKKATMKAIATNSYPLTRQLNLITKGDPSPLALAFITYCQSKAAIPAFRTHNFVKPD